MESGRDGRDHSQCRGIDDRDCPITDVGHVNFPAVGGNGNSHRPCSNRNGRDQLFRRRVDGRRGDTTNAPEPRDSHTAVWTDSEMIVWGGFGENFVVVNTGGSYNPGTDSWTATTTTNAPELPDICTQQCGLAAK